MSRLSREDQSRAAGIQNMHKTHRNSRAISLDQPLLQPNVSGISELEGLRRMEVVPSGQSKRKRQAFAMGDLRTCVCGETATPQSDNVIACKQMGCESKWVSFY
jgi:hypothetical protein